MKSLAMVYRNSFTAWMACSIFAIWFGSEFVPLCYLHSKKLEEKALLLLGPCLAYPSGGNMKLKDDKIRVVFLPKNNTALIQPIDQSNI
jgi:hypothetical protein